MTTPTLYKHQTETVEFIKDRDGVFITSDPGTGKTASVLSAFSTQKQPNERALVLAPLSILQVAWGADCETFTPELRYQTAYAKNRKKAFGEADQFDLTITNHDGVKWLAKPENQNYLATFDWLIIDESTAYKNKNSQRSKAVDFARSKMSKVILMTGTPNNNTIMDIWNQVQIIDGGTRLGDYYSFRSQVCRPVQVANGITQWIDKDGIEDDVADLIKDINIRHKFEDCISIPENHEFTLSVNMSSKLNKLYQQLRKEAMLELDEGMVTAVHAGVLTQKLLQMTSGAVYDEDGETQVLDSERYDLVIELVKERKASVVFFNWAHQKRELVKKAEKENISCAIIDGSTLPSRRIEAVEQFQAGKLQMLLCHPQAAGHGITLTTGTTTIWASPTFNAEHYVQANRRIYRAGQTQKTETIRICAKDTLEVHAYNRLAGKLERMESLLDLLNRL